MLGKDEQDFIMEDRILLWRKGHLLLREEDLAQLDN